MRRRGPAAGRIGGLPALLALATGLLATPVWAQFPVGKPAPRFKLKQLGGKQLSLSSLQGKVVLLDFWGPS